jgi:hypothetical protein
MRTVVISITMFAFIRCRCCHRHGIVLLLSKGRFEIKGVGESIISSVSGTCSGSGSNGGTGIGSFIAHDGGRMR